MSSAQEMDIQRQNVRIYHDCIEAAERLEGMWGQTELPQEEVDAKAEFAWWFGTVAADVLDLARTGRLAQYVADSALQACCDILSLDIPHDQHIQHVIWLRLVLGDNIDILSYTDWPFDISPYLDDDNDED